MIKKQNLWFLTLFSLVLVLSVYYITMPNELFASNVSSKTKNTALQNDSVISTIEESELLVTMRVNLEEERTEQMTNLKSTLTDEDATNEEKNNAYEQIKYITNLSVQEEAIESKIKQSYSIDSFVKIDGNQIKVVAIKENPDVNLANEIMKTIQQEFPNKVSISIMFEK